MHTPTDLKKRDVVRVVTPRADLLPQYPIGTLGTVKGVQVGTGDVLVHIAGSHDYVSFPRGSLEKL
jgi:hypothetical protein